MYTVELPIDGLNRRALPEICPITGEGSQLTWRTVSFSWYPPWANLFLLLGLLPGAIVTSLMTRRANGEMPFHPRAWWRWKLGQLFFGIAFVSAIVGLIVSMVFFGDGATLAGCLMIFISIGTPVATWRLMLHRRGLRVLEITQTHVRLQIPSERAAQALGGQISGSALRLSPSAAKELERAALETHDAPDRATCAVHTSTIAPWCCGRCGSFFCPVCAEYPSKGGKPVCAKCFGAR